MRIKTREVGELGGEDDRGNSAAEGLQVLHPRQVSRQSVPHGGRGNHERTPVRQGGRVGQDMWAFLMGITWSLRWK